MTFKNFAEANPYRHTHISHEDYVMTCLQEGESPSELFNAPGTRLDHVCIDSMHSGDLGAFQDALGSLFWLEVTSKQFHPTIQAGMEELNADLNRYYSANKDRNLTKLTPLAFSQLRSTKECPYLKAKAAETRHAAEFGLILAQKHAYGLGARLPFEFKASSRLAGRTDEHLSHLVPMMEGMVEYHRSCAARPFSPAQCYAAMSKFLNNLSALNRLWAEGLPQCDVALQPWHLRPKAHMLDHMADLGAKLFGSPSRFWCYRDEGYVGVVKASCALPRLIATIAILVRQGLRFLSVAPPEHGAKLCGGQFSVPPPRRPMKVVSTCRLRSN
jgi:hypothetical protein